MKKTKVIAVLLVCLLLAMGLTGYGEENAQVNAGTGFENARIGMFTGSSHAEIAKEKFPDAERVYFSSVTDMLIALDTGRIDCYLEDETFFPGPIWEGANIKREEGAIAQISNAFVFPKDDESDQLREQVNAFVSEAKADGTIDRLREKWLGMSEPEEHPDYSDLSGENGTIRLAVGSGGRPMVYRRNDAYTGFEIELLVLFAREYGYKFDIEEIAFESIIVGLSQGKYDMAACGLNVTPEREESVSFSESYGRFDVMIVTKNDEAKEAGTSKTLADLENGKIGILTGSYYDLVAKEHFPDAERKYFSSHADMITSMSQGKIDAILEDQLICVTMLWEGAAVVEIEEPVVQSQSGFIFSEKAVNGGIQEQINEFIARIDENGQLQALKEKWTGPSEPTEHPDYSGLTGENGTLIIAIGASLKPLSYMKDNQYTGLEIDVLTRFAEEYGYKLEIQGMAFDAIIPSVSTGKCDIGAAGLTITPERSEIVTFSVPYLTTYGVAIVSASDTKAPGLDFWERFAEGFEKTFIRENRWKLILSGVGVTLVISICSAVGGSLLGFGLYMLSRSKKKAIRGIAKGIAGVYSRIVDGTPVVVILMILFYVVFASVRDMSGLLVAIIGFSLTFGAFVFGHLTVSVNSVDNGQTEAAYALGYPRNRAFFRIILPQAMNIFMPSYCSETVSLVKATAVVGYIAVNDLTRIGDIIRSNTYEAFFPLISTAVIYFILTWILSAFLNRIKLRFEPKRRSAATILKGVKVK